MSVSKGTYLLYESVHLLHARIELFFVSSEVVDEVRLVHWFHDALHDQLHGVVQWTHVGIGELLRAIKLDAHRCFANGVQCAVGDERSNVHYVLAGRSYLIDHHLGVLVHGGHE